MLMATLLRSRLTAILLTWSAAAGLAVGAEPKVRFLADRAASDLGEVVLSSAKASSANFELTVNNLSGPQEAPGRTFSLKAAGKDQALAEITLPQNGKAFVVLLLSQADGRYKPAVIPDDGSFKGGEYYIHNGSTQAVWGKIGTTKFLAEPATGKIVKPAGATAQNQYEVAFGSGAKEGEHLLSSTVWPVDDKVRSYVFFFENPTTKRLDFRSVDEFVENAADKR